jgi:putative ABC transport system permease protein
MVWQDYRARNGPEREWFSYPNFADYRAHNRTLEDLAVFQAGTFTVTGSGEPEAVAGEVVSASIFDLLAVPFVQGRGFRPEEASPGAPPVAIVSQELWQRRFPDTPSALGRPIVIDGQTRTVVGVLPAGFAMPLVAEAEVFLPLQAPEPFPGARKNVYLRALGRLKEGVTLDQARADLNAAALRIEQENADADRGIRAAVYPLQDEMMGPARPALIALLVSVAFILLIACVNIANLLLARATARQPEVGLRAALGAEPGRLVRQILTESLLLSVLGGTLGILLAVGGVEILKRLAALASFPLPQIERVQVDAGVLAFTLLLVLATGLLFGLAPALALRRPDLTRVLQGLATGRSTTGRAGRMLVIVEMALTLVLLVGAGLMLRSLDNLQGVDTGYEPSGVLVYEVFTPEGRYPEGHQVRAFYAGLLERMKGLPGVVSAGAVSSLPMGGSNTDAGFRVEGRPAEAERFTLWYRIITPEYFQAAGLPLVRGRGLEERDQEGAPKVVVINEAAADQHFPGEDPVGKALLTSQDRYEIVGVVRNGRSFSLKTEEPPAVYFAHGQVPARTMGIVVRTDEGDPAQLAGPVRAALADLDPSLAAMDLRPLDELIAASVAPEKALGLLVGAFGVLALLLSAVGLYGLMAYLTSQRNREIGIRMALGAGSLRVARMIVGQALTLSTAGLVLGMLAAWALTRVLQSLVFEVSALDPLAFVTSAALLTAVSAVATYLPARRASNVDPAIVLRRT